MASDPLIPINTPFSYNVGINYETWENGRTGYSITADLSWFHKSWKWPGLLSVARVQRVVQRGKTGPPLTEVHYYLCSIPAEAKRLAALVRGHWSVENNLHWQLDVSFDEDHRRIRKDHGAENFSRLCRIALNLLKNEKTAKCGIKTRRLGCGWSNDYLLKVIAG